MKTSKSFFIWLCFVASNILSLAGFVITFHHNKTIGRFLLLISLVFLLGFWIISGFEIYKSSKLTKHEKFIWPILVILLSTFGQIGYLVKRKELN